MARRLRSFAPRRQGPRRATLWVASADVTGFQTLAAATKQLNQSFSDAQLFGAGLAPSTVVRVRGTMWVRSDQNIAVEEPFGALGFAVVSENARASGALGSLPGPIADEPADLWFAYMFFQGGNIAVDATFQNPWSRYDFDSRAMRKVDEGEGIVVMLENAVASHGMQVILKFRMLFKSH